MPVIPGLGDRIREARKRANLSLEELARLSGSNRRSLFDYEKGRVDPRVGDLKKLAEVLGVSVAHLVGEGQDKQQVLPDTEAEIRRIAAEEIARWALLMSKKQEP